VPIFVPILGKGAHFALEPMVSKNIRIMTYSLTRCQLLISPTR
jgi:hypothetical protein